MPDGEAKSMAGCRCGFIGGHQHTFSPARWEPRHHTWSLTLVGEDGELVLLPVYCPLCGDRVRGEPREPEAGDPFWAELDDAHRRFAELSHEGQLVPVLGPAARTPAPMTTCRWTHQYRFSEAFEHLDVIVSVFPDGRMEMAGIPKAR